MTEKAEPNKAFTHVAYFFIKTGGRRGRVYGYWKDGGRFRPDDGENYFAFIDMVVRGGWDGRIRFVKIGDPPPQDQPMPQRPSGHDEDVADGEDENDVTS
jgi:hypothetical protein